MPCVEQKVPEVRTSSHSACPKPFFASKYLPELRTFARKSSIMATITLISSSLSSIDKIFAELYLPEVRT